MGDVVDDVTDGQADGPRKSHADRGVSGFRAIFVRAGANSRDSVGAGDRDMPPGRSHISAGVDEIENVCARGTGRKTVRSRIAYSDASRHHTRIERYPLGAIE